jgi:NADH-quinone oxidoreductase subunit G
VRSEVKQYCQDIDLSNELSADAPMASVAEVKGLQRAGEVPLYAADSLLRRATALQKTKDADQGYAKINPSLAAQMGLQEGEQVRCTQAGMSEFCRLKIDPAVADNCVWLPAALSISKNMGDMFAAIELEKV